MPGRGVRVLAHHQDPDLRQRLPERPKHVRRRWQHLLPGGYFVGQERQDGTQRFFDRGQGLSPVGRHKSGQGLAGHLGKAGNASRRRVQLEQRIGINHKALFSQAQMTSRGSARSMEGTFFRTRPGSVTWPKQRRSTFR